MLQKAVTVLCICLLAFPVGVFATSVKTGTDQGAVEQAEHYFSRSEEEQGPCTKPDGSRFTIGYLDIDPYPATGEMIYRFVEQLRTDGWITYRGDFPFDPENTDAKEFIQFLSEQDLGEYIQFSSDVNYYVSEEYDGEKFVEKDLKKHIENGDVDLIFCLGTQPAELMINKMGITQVPVMVSGTVDPVGAGLAESEEYSGKSNIWCHTNTGVYTNQLKFYYESHPFTNIGMVFYDETIASYEPYKEAADELGFLITTKKTSRAVTEDYYDILRQLYKELVDEGIDAFLLNSDIIKDEEQIAPLLDIFYQKNIPVFVQNSEYFVEDGAMMVVTASDAQTQAPFLADAFSRILHGEEPGSINQKFVTPPYLSVNLEVADRIGYDVSEDMILSAEKLYTYVRNYYDKGRRSNGKTEE